MYINTKTKQYPISEQDIRNQNKNTSFPIPFVPPEPYSLVFEQPKPAYDPLTEYVIPGIPFLTKKGIWEIDWKVIRLSEDQILSNQLSADIAAREKAKAERQAKVDSIQVTTASGNAFDGDETSQTRMTRAILAMQATNTETIRWVLADNTVIDVTAQELTEALSLAGAEQSAIWII